MRFVAIIADNWEQFATKLANHGYHFNVKLGTAVREGTPRVCAVFIDAHDQSFTREKSQGTVYDKHRIFSKSPDHDVVARIVSQTRVQPKRRVAA